MPPSRGTSVATLGGTSFRKLSIMNDRFQPEPEVTASRRGPTSASPDQRRPGLSAIARDLNEILKQVDDTASLLLTITDDPELQRSLHNVRLSSTRGAALTEALSRYGGDGSGTTADAESPECLTSSGPREATILSFVDRVATQPRADQDSVVLVVEDDDAVRRYVEAVLTSAGYRVRSAANGRDALDEIDRIGPQVSLIISDVVLPHLNGWAVASLARGRFPHIRVLHMSGYPRGTLAPENMSDRPGAYLQKPFTLGQLLRHVAESMDNVSATSGTAGSAQD